MLVPDASLRHHQELVPAATTLTTVIARLLTKEMSSKKVDPSTAAAWIPTMGVDVCDAAVTTGAGVVVRSHDQFELSVDLLPVAPVSGKGLAGCIPTDKLGLVARTTFAIVAERTAVLIGGAPVAGVVPAPAIDPQMCGLFADPVPETCRYDKKGECRKKSCR